MASFEQSKSWIPEAWSVIAFYLPKAEKIAKESLTDSHTIALSRGTIFAKNADF